MQAGRVTSKAAPRSQVRSTPLVLAISAHDPTGGAGIQADIQTIAALGCRPVSLITSLSAQNRRHFSFLRPQRPEDLLEQARCLFAEAQVTALKIGAIGDIRLVETIRRIIALSGTERVVLDPVLCSTTGGVFADATCRRALLERLFDQCMLVTPNREEALLLGGVSEPDAAAAALCAAGAGNVLITDVRPRDKQWLTHCCYPAQGPVRRYQHRRLPGCYHGSGCRLAAAIAAFLARGETLLRAVKKGLDHTRQALESSRT